MVYLGVVALLSMLMIESFGSVRTSVQRKILAERQALLLSIARDTLARDVYGASMERAWWRPEQCLFKKQGQSTSIAWVVHQGNLQRIEGVYDFMHGVWQKKTASVVCEHVDAMRCEVLMSPDGRFVEMAVFVCCMGDAVQRWPVHLRTMRLRDQAGER